MAAVAPAPDSTEADVGIRVEASPKLEVAAAERTESEVGVRAEGLPAPQEAVADHAESSVGVGTETPALPKEAGENRATSDVGVRAGDPPAAKEVDASGKRKKNKAEKASPGAAAEQGDEPDAKRPRLAPSLVAFGLGNVGEQFRLQRHNVGERVVRAVTGRRTAKPLHEGETGGETKACVGALSLQAEGRPQILLPPQGAINDSGPSLRDALAAMGHTDAAFLAVVDDCSLPLGIVRLRQKGSSGGHNGLKSIEGVFGQDYHRLKVGIGGPATPEHVCGGFVPGAEADLAEAVVARAAEAVDLWLSSGPEDVQNVMSKVNSPEFRKVEVAPKGAPAAGEGS